MKAVLSVAAVAACLLSPFGHARGVDNLDPIIREMEIAKDVFRSSMSKSLSQDIRIASVDAQYLAQQGVLISINVVRPWFTVSERGQHITFDADFQTISDIPRVVQDIFEKLNISMPPYDTEELDELRELRTEQRELRKEERQLQKKTRVKRREFVRADDTDDREDIAREINDLERELKGVEVQLDALNADLEKQYQRLSEGRSRRSRPDTGLDIDVAVSETACNYGSTFKTLDAQRFLTVAVKQRELTKYFVFKMEHIRACSRDDIDPTELLERSYVY